MQVACAIPFSIPSGFSLFKHIDIPCHTFLDTMQHGILGPINVSVTCGSRSNPTPPVLIQNNQLRILKRMGTRCASPLERRAVRCDLHSHSRKQNGTTCRYILAHDMIDMMFTHRQCRHVDSINRNAMVCLSV